MRTTIVKKLLSLLGVAAFVLGTANFGHAEGESKPWVTVSFAGYDKLVADLALIGKLGGNPNLGKQLEMMALMLPQGEGSKGPLALDTKQPWGAVLASDGMTPHSYAFVPVSDLKPLMEMIKAQTGQEIKVEKGIHEISAQGKTMYAVQKGKWAYVAETPELLTKVAAEPAALLGDLPKRYDLAIRASIQNLPKEYREQLLAQIRAGAEVGMQQLPSESEDEATARAGMAKQSLEQLTTLVNELDDILLGWSVDAKAKTTYLDLELKAQTGAKLAAQFAEIKPGKTAFAGLILPDAAVTASSVGTLGDAQVAQMRTGLAELRTSAAKGLENQGLTEEETKLAARLFSEAIDVVEKTLETKKTDFGMSLRLEPAAVTFLGGIKIADGAKLDKTFQQLIDEVKKNEQTADTVKVESSTVGGIHLHAISMPTPDPQLTPLVGDTLEVVVGIAADKVLVSVGRDAAATIKKAIGNLKPSDKEVPPLHIAVAITPVAKFIAEMGDDPRTKATAGMVAALLERAGTQNHLTVTSQPIAQGVRIRLELEEGVLKALGAMSQMLGGVAPQ